MIYTINTSVESFHVQQKYNATKSPNTPSLSGAVWHYNSADRGGQVPLLRREGGVMKSSMATWGSPTATGEDKYIGQGWPTQPGFIPVNSFIMHTPNRLIPYEPYRFRISRHDGAWFLLTAGWFGVPAHAERQCNVCVTSAPSHAQGIPYQPIMLTADEWVHGASGSLSLANMRIEAI